MPFAPSAQIQIVPHDISDDDLGESDSDLETRITQRQRDLYISRYGDALSESEEDDETQQPNFLKRPPPPPLQLIPAGSASKRPRRTLLDDKSVQQQAQVQQQQHQQQAAIPQIQPRNPTPPIGRGGKLIRSFFPP